jgi:large subunit ribosomal protein L7/L12
MLAGVGGGGAAPAAAAAAPAEAVAEEKPAEKTEFAVKLEGFDAKSKIKVIKEIRAITGQGLKEAKETVEKAPVVIKEHLTKEEADELLAKIEKVGGKVKIE